MPDDLIAGKKVTQNWVGTTTNFFWHIATKRFDNPTKQFFYSVPNHFEERVWLGLENIWLLCNQQNSFADPIMIKIFNSLCAIK